MAAQVAVETCSHREPIHALTFAFRGQGRSLFFLTLKNVLLTLVTLGIYAAWAQTAHRRYMWSNLEIGSRHLHYSGTGNDLFMGYLKVSVGLLTGGVSIYLSTFASPWATIAVLVVFGALLLGVAPYVFYESRRYLLSRTSWRGIHFELTGDAKRFTFEFVLGVVLSTLTLGLYAPIWANRTYRFMTNHTRFGTMPFCYTGDDGEVWRLCMKGFLLTLVTFGIYASWFQVELARYRLAHTHFDGATGSLDLTGERLFKLRFLGAVGTLLSMGIAFPWLRVHALREIVERTSFLGPIDFQAILEPPPTSAEESDELAEMFGVDANW